MHPEDDTHGLLSVGDTEVYSKLRVLHEMNWQLIEFDHIMLICLCHLYGRASARF